MPYVKSKTTLFLLALTLSSSYCWAVENWPDFRGHHGNGIAEAKDLPTRWSEQKNVRWKTPIHDRGHSSPVIWGKQIWLTTATEDGKKLFVLCIDKETGQILLDHQIFDVPEPQFSNRLNSYASPSPVIEEGRVYIYFGTYGTACLDTKTFKVLWQRCDINCDHFQGAGSSPILYPHRCRGAR